MKRETERRLLQLSVAAGSFVPLSMGGMSVVRGADVLKGVTGTGPADLDSHYRYLSGLLLGIGLTFVASIPRIEVKGTVFRTLGALIFVGGVGRLISLIVTGAPNAPHLFGLGMELVVTPLLVLWQARVEREYRS